MLVKVPSSGPISKVRHKGPLPMSLSIHSTPPAAAAANLAPAPAVKSTSDTPSAAALSQKQASSQAAVTPSAPKDTVQSAPLLRRLFRNPGKLPHKPPKRPLTATARQ